MVKKHQTKDITLELLYQIVHFAIEVFMFKSVKIFLQSQERMQRRKRAEADLFAHEMKGIKGVMSNVVD